MVSTERLTQLPGGMMYQAPPTVAPDADSEARWDAWVARGRVHEQRVRRRFVAWGAVLAMGAAIVYAFLRP